jgi:hypothetical protein
MANLTNEELEFIKTGSAEYTKIKIGLGELELQKQGLIKQAQSIVEAFTTNEKFLIDKYGADSVINMQTGEVTKKEKNEN